MSGDERRSILVTKTDLGLSNPISRASEKMALYTTPQRDFITWMAMERGKFNTTLIPPERFSKNITTVWYNLIDFLETARKCIADPSAEYTLLLAGIDWEVTLRRYMRDYSDVISKEGDLVDRAIVEVNRERIRMRLTIDEAFVVLNRTYGTSDHSSEREHYRARVIRDQEWSENAYEKYIIARLKRTYFAIKIHHFMRR